ncbi:MAG: chromate efflux transporter [Steroidobacteraceae bacterium]
MNHSAWEVFKAFLKSGVTAFGGPIAHLGYFREEFVQRRRWLDEHAYADLVSLCQFLPGPASSQVGFSLGLMRAGLPGALAAWVGFTLPSTLLLLLFALYVESFSGPAGVALLHGLKLAAVGIVAQAVWTMARTLCPDWPRVLIATASALFLIWAQTPSAQVAVIIMGAVAGFVAHRSGTIAAPLGHLPTLVPRRMGLSCLLLFALLLAGLPVLQWLRPGTVLALFDAFYRAGALVFGGGHVVLPLLHESFVTTGWVDEDRFLAGYGAAQAVPGPLFTFAAYLGAISSIAPTPVLGAAIGIVGLFLPGMLVLAGVLPFWEALRRLPRARGVMAGVNAAVVGLLAAALWTPVWTGTVRGIADGLLAVGGFGLLVGLRAPPLIVVALFGVAAVLFRLALRM